MKTKLTCLFTALIAFGPALLRADDANAKPENRPSREEMREKWKSLSPEEREAKMKEWREKHPGGPGGPGGPDGQKNREEFAKQLGLNPEEMKNLSPEERRAKFRDAVQKKTAELKEKKEKGTLTDDDKKLAARLQQMRQGMEDRRRPEGGPDNGGKADPRDARKPAIQDGKTDEKK